MVAILWLFSFSSVQFSCSVVSDSLWPHESQPPGLPVHHQLPEFTQTQVHRVGDAIQPSHPLSSPSPPAPIPPSIRVFSNESTLRMRWPKYWSFSFSIIPSTLEWCNFPSPIVPSIFVVKLWSFHPVTPLSIIISSLIRSIRLFALKSRGVSWHPKAGILLGPSKLRTCELESSLSTSCLWFQLHVCE